MSPPCRDIAVQIYSNDRTAVVLYSIYLWVVLAVSKGWYSLDLLQYIAKYNPPPSTSSCFFSLLLEGQTQPTNKEKGRKREERKIERKKDRKKERRKEGRKEGKKDRKKVRKKERKKERKKARKKERKTGEYINGLGIVEHI